MEKALKKLEWVQSEKGSIAVVWALSLSVCLALIGSAIDYKLYVRSKAEMQTSLDAAVLAAAVSNDGSDLAALVSAMYASNAKIGATANVTPSTSDSGRTISATASGKLKTIFMAMFGYKNLDLQVASAATAPITIKSVKFEATGAGGWWEKTVRLMVTRPGSTKPEEVVNVHYQPRGLSGFGAMTVTPAGTVDVGAFTSAYLEFSIGPVAPHFKQHCGPDCPTLLRSDDPATSDRFTIDGVPVPRGKVVDIFEWAKCGQVSKQDWEDGGGATPDIHYTIETVCGVSPGTARINK